VGYVNNHGFKDLYVSNLAHPRFLDFSDQSQLLFIEPGGSENRFEKSGIQFEESSADPSFADVDKDGDLDLYITSIYRGRPSHLYRNEGKGWFTDITWLSNNRVTNAWGAAFSDFDNDGDLDLLVASSEGVRLLQNQRVSLVRNGQTVWNARAQVGKPYRETPVFRSTMKHLVFNPTWTVPPTILAEDILPRVKRDPDYLRHKNIEVINRKGKVINPKSINWSKYTARNFPYQLRQGPGPSNALGRVKFMFPNQHLVYLHDTPSKSLFDRAERTFSSGCIRTEDPFTLAELLLDDKSNWNQESIRKVIDSKKTRTVRLTKPLSVMLLYWTVDVDDQGIVNFKKDVYGRDKRIIAALHGDFVFSAPGGMPDWSQRTAR